MNKQLYLPLAVAMALATGTATAGYHGIEDINGGDDGGMFDGGPDAGGVDDGYAGGGDDNGGVDDGYAGGGDDGYVPKDYDWGDKGDDGKVPDMADGKDYVPPEFCDIDKKPDGDGRGKPDDGGVGVIPIPAAAWLFGSGLVGLVGMAKRRSRRV